MVGYWLPGRRVSLRDQPWRDGGLKECPGPGRALPGEGSPATSDPTGRQGGWSFRPLLARRVRSGARVRFNIAGKQFSSPPAATPHSSWGLGGTPRFFARAMRRAERLSRMRQK
jgi:hypothetical protein